MYYYVNMKYKIIIPEQYFNKKQELLNYFNKFNPLEMLSKYSGKVFKGDLVIRHKALGSGADFKNNEVYLDFRKNIEYLFLAVCHESAHILLRQKPAWYEDKNIKKIILKNKSYKSKKYNYDFQYAVEQTLAAFLQVACENEAGLRDLSYKNWEQTFNSLDIKEFAKKLFPEFKKYYEKT